eukprot:COSAG06_NODE_55362_length_290_cov_0.497382_1_plen_42_part_01
MFFKKCTVDLNLEQRKSISIFFSFFYICVCFFFGFLLVCPLR